MILEKRITDFDLYSQLFLSNVPKKCVFDHTSSLRIRSDVFNKQKINLNHFIYYVKKLKSGSYNQVFLINYAFDVNKFHFIFHIPKVDKIKRRSYYDVNDSDIDDECVSIACISSYYSLLFSNIVKKNIFPNFTQIVDIFFCNKRFPITIQEAADYDLFEFINDNNNNNNEKENNNIDSSDNAILQSLLTYHFMSECLEISHFDAKPSNIVIKELSEDIILNYELSETEVVTLKTNKLALVIDFDFTRGSFMHYEMKNIFTSYLKKYLKDEDKYTETIRKCYNAYIPTRHNYDIFHFCCLLLMCKCCDSIKIKIELFITDYIITNISLFECIKKHYSNILYNNNNNEIKSVNDIKINEYTYKFKNYGSELMNDDFLNFMDNRSIVCRMLTHRDMHGTFCDRYIKHLFGIDNIIKNIQLYVSKNLSLTDSSNDKGLCDIIGKELMDKYPQFLTSYNNLLYLKIYKKNKLSTYEILSTLFILRIYLDKNPSFEPIDYDLLTLVCLYLTNFQQYSFNELLIMMNKLSSKYILYKIMKSVLCILYTYKSN